MLYSREYYMMFSPPYAECMSPGIKEVALGVDALTIITSNLLAVFLLPMFVTLSCIGLEVLLSKRRKAFTRGHSNNFTELEDKTAMWPFGLHMSHSNE